MSPREVAWRAVQLLRSRARSTSSIKSVLPYRAAELRNDLPALTRAWPISYFSVSFLWDGNDIAWQGSAHNDRLATVHWSRINYRDTAAIGDPKQIWELNRHQFLRHWILSTDISIQERVDAVSHLLLQWIEKNPYGRGMNWTSSLELALRLMAWESCLTSLGKNNFDPQVIEVVEASVVEHCLHLRQQPSLYSSANNHRVGELVGEMAAAAMFPDHSTLSSAAKKAWALLQIEARRQVTRDGICREQAYYYHAYTMLYFKRAASYAKSLFLAVPPCFTDLTQKMQDALDAVTDEQGNWFEIGDRDDGDLHALQPLQEEPQSVSVPARIGFFHYQDGGYAVWKTPAFHLLFRCGQFGYPSIAAHAHCDQLSVLLKMNNKDILTDSGTGSYHENETWRRYFRGTTAHNTIRVNDEDQAEYGGPFLWNTAPAGVISEALPAKVIGSTNAWICRLYPVTHQRSIEFDPENIDFLRVHDNLMPESHADHSRKYELIWNFGLGITVHSDETNSNIQKPSDVFYLTIILEHEPILRMTISLSDLSWCAIHHGDESLPAGFYSRKLGERIPITQVRITGNSPAWRASTFFSRIETA